MSTISFHVSADGSTWVTPASLGMEGVVLTKRINGLDELSWTVKGPLDADPAWAYADTIYLRQTTVTNGVSTSVVRFIGRVEDIPPQGDGVEESIAYRAVGWWWWLQRMTYSQSWMKVNPANGQQYSVPVPRVIAGQAVNGATEAMSAHVASVLNSAITRGAPFQLGTVDTLVTMPKDEQTNVTHEAALLSCIRLFPDLCLWADYNTTKTVDGVTTYCPTVHCRKASNLAGSTLTIGTDTIGRLHLKPRYDIQKPGFRVVFESTFTTDGAQYPSVSIDTAGNVNDPRCVDLCYDLAGGSAEYLKQPVQVAAYPVDPNDKTFWRAMLPWLSGIADADLTITGAAGDGELSLDNYLVAGAIADWMSVDQESETWTATVAYARRDASNNIVAKVDSKKVSVTLTSTSATTQTYKKLVSFDSGESVPLGVAAALYASWGRLHYDGQVRIQDQECAFAAQPGNVLNLAGGRAAWATMNAIVQDAVFELDSGVTNLTIGTGGRCEADSEVALFTAARCRRFAFSANSRADAAAVASSYDGPTATPSSAASDGDPGEVKMQRWSGKDTGDRTHVVTIDPASIAFASPTNAAAKTIQFREIRVLEKQADSSYKAKLAQVPCSATYDAAGGDNIGAVLGAEHSVELESNGKVHLVGDTASPGNNMVYATNGSGTRGWIDTVLLTAP